MLGFHPTFSRHGIAQILSALALLIWLNEKVLFPSFCLYNDITLFLQQVRMRTRILTESVADTHSSVSGYHLRECYVLP